MRLLAAGAAVLSVLALPAFAQPAREGNIWNGNDHEPSAGPVQNQERAAGVAPTQSQAEREDQTLNRIGNQLQQRAQKDAQTPGIQGTYGVQPGGVVKIAPNVTGGGGGSGGGGGGGGGQ